MESGSKDRLYVIYACFESPFELPIGFRTTNRSDQWEIARDRLVANIFGLQSAVCWFLGDAEVDEFLLAM